jgi:hypothetical protein
MILGEQRGGGDREFTGTNHEQDIESPPGVCHSNGCNLTDHRASAKRPMLAFLLQQSCIKEKVKDVLKGK